MKGINKEILSLAIPSIITNITTPLLALMDVAIVGHMGDATYIAAIAIGGTIFNMAYWLFAFLRMGTSGLAAQAFGAEDSKALNLVLARGLCVAIICALAILLLSPLIAAFSFAIMEVEGAVRELAAKYFSILVWGAPAVLSTYTLSGWALGRKSASTPMWISLIINISNILISLILVLGFKLKIEGVAYGTLCAQWIGAITFFILVIKRFHPSLSHIQDILDTRALKHFFSINADIFLRTLCLIAVTVWFTRSGSSQGITILAVNTLLMQFFMLFSYFMDGFAFAGESLCGNCLGAKDKNGLIAVTRRLLAWGAGVAAVFTIIYAVGGQAIMRLLSSDIDVITASKEYFDWVIIIPAAGFMAFTWDGIFIGITRTREMLLSIALSSALYFALYFILRPHLGNHGLWLAFLAYLFSRGLILHLLNPRTREKLFRES